MTAVVKTFQTPKGKYVYDRGSDSILAVGNEEFSSLERLESGVADSADWKVLKRYKNQGYLSENSIKKIAYSETFRYQLSSQLQQLTLQVTHRCNLRCSYCTYGGGYENQRIHGEKEMLLSTMKKAIDFAMARSREVNVFTIGFYGGEPLLEIDKIRQCVEYIKETYDGREVMYTVTTNGTLLNDQIIRFLSKNNFHLAISLDGSKEMHNKNRVYINGQGSFDDIMKNMNYIKEKYSNFFKNISFLTTVAPGVDFSKVNHFFNEKNVISGNAITCNMVSELNAKEDVVFDDQYHVTNNYQKTKVLLAALGLYEKKKVSRLFSRDISRTERFYQDLSKMTPSGTVHPGGPCVPGALRLFVTVDGVFYPCERVSEDSEVMKIGHVESGFELDKIVKILNVGKLTERECKKCWNFLHCTLCCAYADTGGELSKMERLSYCKSAKNSTLEEMYIICLLLENGYDFKKKMK